MKNTMDALWRYRGYIKSAVVRELQARYQDSMLGSLWTLIQPLAMVLIYTLVFSNLMQSRLPGMSSGYAYSIFLMAGLLPWNLFAEMIQKGQGMFLGNAAILKKVKIPKICIPVIVLGGSLVNFVIVFTLFQIFLLLIGAFPGWLVLAAIPLLILQLILAWGLAILLGVLNVFFRDVGQFFSIFIQLWFWLTPIVYSLAIIPVSYQHWFYYNPVTPLMIAYQHIFLLGQLPIWGELVPLCLVALIINGLAFYVFRKRAAEMVDEL